MLGGGFEGLPLSWCGAQKIARFGAIAEDLDFDQSALADRSQYFLNRRGDDELAGDAADRLRCEVAVVFLHGVVLLHREDPDERA